MFYIDVAIMVVVVIGAQGFGGLACVLDARQRDRCPFRAFLLGICFGLMGYMIQRRGCRTPLPEHVQDFAALYFLFLLFLLSMLNAARLALGVG
jgi:hypothetical protein